MQTKTLKFIDKSTWPAGPWKDEPDKMQWEDESTKLPCLVVRQKSSGHWCGYVGVAEGHPLFNVEYNAESARIYVLEVHGGLTFSDFCAEDKKETGVCHEVCAGENDRVWWLGFDCAHCDDLSPTNRYRANCGEYRDLDYVRNECTNLAAQLASMK